MHNLATLDEPRKPDDDGSHDFESIGSILRRMLEPAPGAAFDPARSLALDRAIQHEDAVRGEDAA